MVMSNGPPALSGLRTTFQRPSFAVVETVCFWNVTVTFSPLRASPQIGTGIFCCSTALSVKRPLGLTSAVAEVERTKRKVQNIEGLTRRFIDASGDCV